MNTDKLMELVEKLRDAELFEDGVSADLFFAGVHTIAAAYMRGRQDSCDELAAALRAEQAVGDEQRARDERNSCDCHPETCGCPEWRVVLDGKFFIGGNRETCKTVAAAMNTAFDLAARRALGAARQSEGMVVWVLERTRDGAIRAVQREAPDDFDMTVAEDENNRYVRYVAAAPGGEGEG